MFRYKDTHKFEWCKPIKFGCNIFQKKMEKICMSHCKHVTLPRGLLPVDLCISLPVCFLSGVRQPLARVEGVTTLPQVFVLHPNPELATRTTVAFISKGGGGGKGLYRPQDGCKEQWVLWCRWRFCFSITTGGPFFHQMCLYSTCSDFSRDLKYAKDVFNNFLPLCFPLMI